MSDAPKSSRQATRAVVVSDLHLGRPEPPSRAAMSQPKVFAKFVEELPGRLASDEALELVIAGDFVDFIATAPHSAWTPDPAEASAKLRQVMASDSACGPIFDELGRLMARGHRLTVLLGNHDLELGLPAVQAELLRHLGVTPHQLHFVDDGRAYRIGRALIEHGNRYDGANANDWDGLRSIASAQSRGEQPPVNLKVSFGSQLVERVITPLKPRYPFIDLLQPEGELVALLLLAFEPQLLWEWEKWRVLLRAARAQRANPDGAPPGRTREVADQAEIEDEALVRVFGDRYRSIAQADVPLGLVELAAIAWTARNDSLSEMLRANADIPTERLAQIRLALRRLLVDDRSCARNGPVGPCGKAAERILAESCGEVEVVVMGHTHLARHIGAPERATYINAGTWIDIIRVPDAVVTDDECADAALVTLLRTLLADVRPEPRPTWADLRVEAGGRVSKALLRDEWS